MFFKSLRNKWKAEEAEIAKQDAARKEARKLAEAENAKRDKELAERKHYLLTKENPTLVEMDQLKNMIASETADTYAQKVAQSYIPIGD